MQKICKYAILGITFLHVIHIITPLYESVLACLTLVLFLFGLPAQKKGFRTITLFFLLFGIGILIAYNLPFSIWVSSLNSMTNIIAIIVVMQLFAMPIEVGKYGDAVEYWLKRLFQKESSLYLFAMVVTNLFSSFLLFGTVPVMVALFDKALKNSISEYKRFFATAIMRGYTLVLFWAPGAVMILLVMQVTHVKWSELFVPGLMISTIGLLTSYLIEHFSGLNKPILNQITIPLSITHREATYKSLHIILVILGLISSITLLEMLGIGTSTGRILLAGFIVSTVWILYYIKHAALKKVMQQYWQGGITQATDFAIFFIAVGLFAGAVDHSGILELIQPLLQESVNHMGIFALIIIPVVFIAIAVCGIHPFVLVVMLGKILLALTLPLNNVSIALILMLSSAIAFIISPFAGMSLMTAKFLHVTPFDVSIRWNLLFCILFLVEGLIFAYVWSL